MVRQINANLDDLEQALNQRPISKEVSAAVYYVTEADDVVLVDATSAAATVYLPPTSKRVTVIDVKKIDATANTVTVTANGTDLIDGAATMVIAAQWVSLTLCPIRTGWAVI